MKRDHLTATRWCPTCSLRFPEEKLPDVEAQPGLKEPECVVTGVTTIVEWPR